MNPTPIARYKVPAVIAGTLLLGACILFFVNPENARYLPRCFFHDLTGLYCAGCGSTRTLHHLLHGRIGTALSMNPLVVVLLPFVVVLGIDELRRWANPDRRPLLKIRAGWIWALFFVVLTYAIVRNIPVHPFTLLAPG